MLKTALSRVRLFLGAVPPQFAAVAKSVPTLAQVRTVARATGESPRNKLSVKIKPIFTPRADAAAPAAKPRAGIVWRLAELGCMT